MCTLKQVQVGHEVECNYMEILKTEQTQVASDCISSTQGCAFFMLFFKDSWWKSVTNATLDFKFLECLNSATNAHGQNPQNLIYHPELANL